MKKKNWGYALGTGLRHGPNGYQGTLSFLTLESLKEEYKIFYGGKAARVPQILKPRHSWLWTETVRLGRKNEIGLSPWSGDREVEKGWRFWIGGMRWWIETYHIRWCNKFWYSWYTWIFTNCFVIFNFFQKPIFRTWRILSLLFYCNNSSCININSFKYNSKSTFSKLLYNFVFVVIDLDHFFCWAILFFRTRAFFLLLWLDLPGGLGLETLGKRISNRKKKLRGKTVPEERIEASERSCFIAFLNLFFSPTIICKSEIIWSTSSGWSCWRSKRE